MARWQPKLCGTSLPINKFAKDGSTIQGKEFKELLFDLHWSANAMTMRLVGFFDTPFTEQDWAAQRVKEPDFEEWEFDSLQAREAGADFLDEQQWDEAIALAESQQVFRPIFPFEQQFIAAGASKEPRVDSK